MTTNRRWKVLCAVLAATTVYAWLRDPAPSGSREAAAGRARAHGSAGLRFERAALGMSAPELVERILAAHDRVEMEPFAQRLALVGGDEAIKPLLSLVADTRVGVSDLVIDVIGKLGTDTAVDTLIVLTKDRRDGVAANARYALGETGNPKAEAFLIDDLLLRPSYESINAVGKFAVTSEAAVDALARVAQSAASDTARYAFESLGELHTSKANAALRALMDSPDVATARMAIDYLEEVDEETLARLTVIAKSGDAELGRSAITALGKAGDAAGPVLATLALEGFGELRATAISALGGVKSDLSFKTLTTLVETTDGEYASFALGSIAKLDMPGTRDFLISVAMSERSLAENAISEIGRLDGADVDAALITLASSNRETSRTALDYLLTREHPRAIEMAIARATTGNDDARYEALQLLANSGNAEARAAMLDVVRDQHGSLKVRSLQLLGEDLTGDPGITELMSDMLRSGSPEEASAAASALGGVGTVEARDALVAALSTTDEDVLWSAVRSLDTYRLDDETAAALARTAEEHPAVGNVVMPKLIAMNSPHGVRLAEAALNSGDRDEAARTLQSLRGIQSPAALHLIEDTIHTSEGEMRSIALRALGETRDPQAVDIVASALDDSDPRVRENVAYALQSIGGDKARDALLGMTRSTNPEDRVAAIQNLRDDDRVVQQRISEMLRDPSPQVVSSAMYAFARSSNGASDLRAMVLDGGRPYETRYLAAMALERSGYASDETTAWLATAQEPSGQ